MAAILNVKKRCLIEKLFKFNFLFPFVLFVAILYKCSIKYFNISVKKRQFTPAGKNWITILPAWNER